MSICIVAIDPGLTGAIAFYYPEKPDRVAVHDMPVVGSAVNAAALRLLLERYAPNVAVIERVGPMPRDGVMQAWRFSAAFTTANVVCALSNIPIVLITPSQWKRAMKLPGGKAAKDQARTLAIATFPACSDAFARKKDAGRAEAALLAIYYIHYSYQPRRDENVAAL